MDDHIVFEDPPPNQAGQTGKIFEFLRPLREHPSEWARVKGPTKRNRASIWATQLKNGRCIGCPAGHYEAVTRQIDGEVYVWARYVGNGSSS